jgi:hypothetical protein
MYKTIIKQMVTGHDHRLDHKVQRQRNYLSQGPIHHSHRSLLLKRTVLDTLNTGQLINIEMVRGEIQGHDHRINHTLNVMDNVTT